MAVNKVKAKAQPATESEGSEPASAEPAQPTAERALALADAASKSAETAPAPDKSGVAAKGNDGQVKAVFGVVLDIKGKQLVLNSDTITELETKGFELGTTEPLDLGTFKDMLAYLSDTLHVMIPDWQQLPAPFNDFAGKVEELHVIIDKAHIKVFPTKKSDGTAAEPQPTQYTLQMRVVEVAQDKNLAQLGPIGLKGFLVGVTNEDQKPAGTTP